MDFAALKYGHSNANCGNVSNSYYTTINFRWQTSPILEWLSPIVPWERHRAVCERRVPGVGDWFLRGKEFEKWRTSGDQAVHRIFFCYGDPGMGKTYLSSLVIDKLCGAFDEDNVAVAYVYCDFHAHKEQSATGLLAALLKQLIEAVDPIPGEIKKTYERAKREAGGRGPTLPEICAMFIKSLPSLQRGFICVDALDEFPAKHRPALWASLQNIVRECPNVRLFITGRPHIREEAREYFPGYPDLPPIKPTEEDIQEYIVMRLERDLESDAMDAELNADILRIVPDRAGGKLLLVSLIMDAILEGVTIFHRRETLHHTMTNGFSLDDAYSTTLDRIKAQKGNKGRLGMQVLVWVSCSERPLKVEELCYALGVEVGANELDVTNVPSIRTLLRYTSGLVTIDGRASTVRLVHLTLQEYLLENPTLSVAPHSMMAEICLTFLNFRSIRDLPPTSNTVTTRTPFIHYASCYWGSHAKKELSEATLSLALQILTQYPDHISANILLGKMASQPLRGFTGLHCVAYLGITEIAVAMVEMRTWDLNGRDSTGATPLMWAARYKNYNVAMLLLRQEDVDPNLSDNDGLTPLSLATISGEEALVKLLIEREDVNLSPLDNYSRTPLIFAARSGHEGIVKLLLARGGLDPDKSDNRGQTALSSAAEEGHEGVVGLLLERKDINPSSPDHNGRTPISFAAGSGNEDVVELLLQREGVNPSSPNNNGRTPLSFAAWSGNEGAVRLFLEHGDVNPDSSDNYGQTPLLWASRSGHEGVIPLLLEREGVNPDASDIYNQTPLLWAARSGHESAVKLLLEREGLNPNRSNTNGRTPLFFAASSGREGIVKLFLQRQDVNLDSPDNKGRTPLSRAAMKGHEGVVKLLLGRGDVEVNSPDKDGRTPLSLAAMRGCEGVVKLLSQPKQLTPELPQSNNKQTEHTPEPAVAGSQEVAESPPAPPQEVDISPETTNNIIDPVPLPHPSESRPSTPDAPPPSASALTTTPVFWISCGVLLLFCYRNYQIPD